MIILFDLKYLDWYSIKKVDIFKPRYDSFVVLASNDKIAIPITETDACTEKSARSIRE